MNFEQIKDITFKYLDTKQKRICAAVCVLFVLVLFFYILVAIQNSIQAREWYNTGMNYFNKRDFHSAAHYLEKSADAGNSDAQDMLDYEHGRKPDTSHISFETTLQWKANYERGY